MSTKILMIGAGAVGQVYARHLQLGGAEITLFVKPKYAEACRAGYPMWPLSQSTKVMFEGYDVLTDLEAIGQTKWDQIWMAMSSPALRQPWFDVIPDHLGDATLVTLQPGLEDRAWLLRKGIPETQLVSGLINMISYLAPLPEEDREPGVAYWFPPMSALPFSGPPDRVASIVKLLNAGGAKAKAVKNVPGQMAFGSSLMMPIIAALGNAGWTFKALLNTEAADQACAAVRQASAIAAPGEKRWLVRLVGSKLGLRFLTWIAPKVVPIPLETYLRVHFTKVGDQTRDTLQCYIRRGQADGLPHGALTALAEALGER